VLAEYDSAGVFQRLYIYGNYIDEVPMMADGTNDYYYTHDHLYSTAALIDTNGEVVERYEGACPERSRRNAYGNVHIMDGTIIMKKNRFDLRLITIAILVLSLVPFLTGCGSRFTLVWHDDFNSFDPSRWEKATHTWNENLAEFMPENITFKGGIMTLHLADKPTPERKYSGAEYRTKDSYLYGKFIVRMKAAPGSGVISSFFTYRDPPDDPTWNEIDIEFLGKDTSIIQFNPWWGWWPNCEPKIYDLPFDAADDFHEYTFEWTPDYIRWTVDGDTYHIFRGGGVNLSQKIMMNIWISSNTDWAGPFKANILPTAAQYDYVKYYRLN